MLRVERRARSVVATEEEEAEASGTFVDVAGASGEL
eukprot:CAMPEP_0115883212 /NCGR_PEP_ID=MMETSP0287-20121206/29445_1 /TAXON_ID=412157 /ORGANISM="Chrysochromulina rotalis, Strain UIO044" /LENGTH=35 /DNA_ID= /DNA_START= /DNA_END= /DNA_ORIENTATION=